MNNEQKKRRKRGDVKAWFDVIDFLVIRSTGGVRQLPDATLIEQWPVCFLLPEPNLILQYEFRA
jgi:hypothetical protein